MLTKLNENDNFFIYQSKTIKDVQTMPSHIVIENHIKEYKEDYRLEDTQHPIKELRNRKVDNVTIGRIKK